MAKIQLLSICVITFVMPAACIFASAEDLGEKDKSTENVDNLTGPTIYMSYAPANGVSNPVENFMYFIPLIAPTAVDAAKSVDNCQQNRVISYRKVVSRKSFSVFGEFEMKGSGSYINVFEPNEMMEENRQYFKQGRPLKYMLDFIKFQGEVIERMAVALL